MSNSKLKLISVILENDKPEQAILTASAIIFDFLKQQESSQPPLAGYQHLSCQTHQAF
jgi:hypothetical protein